MERAQCGDGLWEMGERSREEGRRGRRAHLIKKGELGRKKCKKQREHDCGAQTQMESE